VKTKLLKKDENLTVDHALDLIRTEEVTRRQVADMSDTKHVHAVHVNEHSYYKSSHPHRSRGQHTPSHRILSRTKCSSCGLAHSISPKQAGPAWDTICDKCGKCNLWKPVCPSNQSLTLTLSSSHVTGIGLIVLPEPPLNISTHWIQHQKKRKISISLL